MYAQKVAQQSFGQVWGNLGKNPSHAQKNFLLLYLCLTQRWALDWTWIGLVRTTANCVQSGLDPACKLLQNFVSGVKRNFWLAKFLTSHHVRMHRIIFYIPNMLIKLIIRA